MAKAKQANVLPEGAWILAEMLKVAMEDEKRAYLRCRILAKMARNEKDRRQLFAIADDEKRHLRLLSHMFHVLFGKQPPAVRVRAPKLGRFDEEIGRAIIDAYESIAFYREIEERLDCEKYQDILHTIMAQEQDHSELLEHILGYCQKRA